MYNKLNSEFTVSEIRNGIKHLKRNKSAGIDNVLNEYFIECADHLVRPLQILFNNILDSGAFPNVWSKGIIVPILKKSPSDDVNNYRGVTLISCFGKLFTSVLNNRLKSWALKYEKLTDAQFGFKTNHSTSDAIFVLHNLVQMHLDDKKRIYAAYVDYSQCFDRIYRSGLWYKLKEGIDGKILNSLRSLYSEVKSCVKHTNKLSDFFENGIGLFQGEIISPILFNLFVNDIETMLYENINSGLTLDQLSIILIMFADDYVLLSETAEGLQNHLNTLQRYCDRWKLKVNVDKTKVMVFRKGGQLRQTDVFTFNGINIEVVESYNYLGFVMSSG